MVSQGHCEADFISLFGDKIQALYVLRVAGRGVGGDHFHGVLFNMHIYIVCL
jgi:hypothetical protein